MDINNSPIPFRSDETLPTHEATTTPNQCRRKKVNRMGLLSPSESISGCSNGDIVAETTNLMSQRFRPDEKMLNRSQQLALKQQISLLECSSPRSNMRSQRSIQTAACSSISPASPSSSVLLSPASYALHYAAASSSDDIIHGAFIASLEHTSQIRRTRSKQNVKSTGYDEIETRGSSSHQLPSPRQQNPRRSSRVLEDMDSVFNTSRSNHLPRQQSKKTVETLSSPRRQQSPLRKSRHSVSKNNSARQDDESPTKLYLSRQRSSKNLLSSHQGESPNDVMAAFPIPGGAQSDDITYLSNHGNRTASPSKAFRNLEDQSLSRSTKNQSMSNHGGARTDNFTSLSYHGLSPRDNNMHQNRAKSPTKTLRGLEEQSLSRSSRNLALSSHGGVRSDNISSLSMHAVFPKDSNAHQNRTKSPTKAVRNLEEQSLSRSTKNQSMSNHGGVRSDNFASLSYHGLSPRDNNMHQNRAKSPTKTFKGLEEQSLSRSSRNLALSNHGGNLTSLTNHGVSPRDKNMHQNRAMSPTKIYRTQEDLSLSRSGKRSSFHNHGAVRGDDLISQSIHGGVRRDNKISLSTHEVMSVNRSNHQSKASSESKEVRSQEQGLSQSSKNISSFDDDWAHFDSLIASSSHHVGLPREGPKDRSRVTPRKEEMKNLEEQFMPFFACDSTDNSKQQKSQNRSHQEVNIQPRRRSLSPTKKHREDTSAPSTRGSAMQRSERKESRDKKRFVYPGSLTPNPPRDENMVDDDNAIDPNKKSSQHKQGQQSRRRTNASDNSSLFSSSSSSTFTSPAKEKKKHEEPSSSTTLIEYDLQDHEMKHWSTNKIRDGRSMNKSRSARKLALQELNKTKRSTSLRDIGIRDSLDHLDDANRISRSSTRKLHHEGKEQPNVRSGTSKIGSERLLKTGDAHFAQTRSPTSPVKKCHEEYKSMRGLSSPHLSSQDRTSRDDDDENSTSNSISNLDQSPTRRSSVASRSSKAGRNRLYDANTDISPRSPSKTNFHQHSKIISGLTNMDFQNRGSQNEDEWSMISSKSGSKASDRQSSRCTTQRNEEAKSTMQSTRSPIRMPQQYGQGLIVNNMKTKNWLNDPDDERNFCPKQVAFDHQRPNASLRNIGSLGRQNQNDDEISIASARLQRKAPRQHLETKHNSCTDVTFDEKRRFKLDEVSNGKSQVQDNSDGFRVISSFESPLRSKNSHHCLSQSHESPYHGDEASTPPPASPITWFGPSAVWPTELNDLVCQIDTTKNNNKNFNNKNVNPRRRLSVQSGRTANSGKLLLSPSKSVVRPGESAVFRKSKSCRAFSMTSTCTGGLLINLGEGNKHDDDNTIKTSATSVAGSARGIKENFQDKENNGNPGFGDREDSASDKVREGKLPFGMPCVVAVPDRFQFSD